MKFPALFAGKGSNKILVGITVFMLLGLLLFILLLANIFLSQPKNDVSSPLLNSPTMAIAVDGMFQTPSISAVSPLPARMASSTVIPTLKDTVGKPQRRE